MSDFVKNIKNKLSAKEDILIDEVKKGNVENVRMILTESPDIVNITSESGATPLLYAIQNSNFQIVELLLSKGADINKRSATGASPLLFAIQKGRNAIVNALIENGADINERHIQNGSTPLLIAAQHGHIDIVKQLVRSGAIVNKANNHGVTPMHVAVKNEHNDIVIYLIENGARRRKSTQSGISPVKIAKDKKDYVMASLLHKWKFMEIDKSKNSTTAAKIPKNNSPFIFMEGI